MRKTAETPKWYRVTRFPYAVGGGILALTSLAVVALPGPVAQAATQKVTNCNDSGTGSLRQAVANAGSGDTVAIGPLTSCGTITVTSGPITIATNLTLSGPGANVMAVSGNGTVEDFDVDAGVTASISGLTIKNGYATNGGGVLNNGTLTVSSSIVSGNTAKVVGGGIANNGTLTVTGTTLSDNAADIGGGGAIAALSGATTTVTNSTLSGNNADDQGGAIFSAGPVNDDPAAGTVAVENSTLSNNTATAYGGAIANGGPLDVIRSTLSGNSAGNRGGAIESFGGPMLIGSSTLADNSAADGGGFENDGSSDTTVVTSTLSGNTGGDITQLAGPLNLEATIVANSTAGPDCSGTIIDHGENLADDGSCGLSAPADIPDSPAGLDPRGLEDNGGPTATIALEPGSPAIGGVDGSDHATVCASPDQRGVTRPDPCDIGAVDAVLQTQSINFTSSAPTGARVGGPTYAVAAEATSGLPVSLTIDATTTSVCSLSGATVSFIGTGLCVIDANQPGAGLYSPAPQVQQSFDVGSGSDAITSADAVTAVAGTHFSFTVTTSGALSLAKKGNLPPRDRFVDNGDGTATLSGTPRKAGTFPLTIKARFGKGKDKRVVTQAFTLTVDPK